MSVGMLGWVDVCNLLRAGITQRDLRLIGFHLRSTQPTFLALRHALVKISNGR